MGNHKTRFGAECDRIERIHREAEKLMGLDAAWTIEVIFDPGYDGDMEYDEEHTIHATCAVTTTRPEYLTAKVRYFLPITLAKSDETMFFVAVHELCHVINSVACRHLPLGKKNINQDEELATERMARAIMAAAGMEIPR
jgi:hypothetical protein